MRPRVTKQAGAVGLARSTVYYLPRPAPAADLVLMRQLDELHLEFPFAGALSGGAAKERSGEARSDDDNTC